MCFVRDCFLRDQRVISVLLEHEVHMTGSVRVAVQLLEKLAHRPVVWNRVRHGKDSFEPEVPRCVAGQHGSSVRTSPVGMLDVVEAFGVGFPDVNACVGNRVSFHVFDRAKDEQGFAVLVLRD